MSLTSRARAVARRLQRLLVAGCWSAAGPALKAELLERFSEDMITESPIPGGVLAFYTPTTLLQHRAADLLGKEQDMIAWLDGLSAGDVLWDVGANVGVFSLYAASRAGCRVLAFEPSAPNYYVLARNILLNRLDARIQAYCIALAGETTLGSLNLAGPGLGLALGHFGQPGATSRYVPGAGDCRHGMVGFTVDEFIERFRPPFPTHFKMDVDGLEWPILLGGRATLSDRRVRSAMIELSVSDPDERARALAFLGECGLRLVSMGPEQSLAGQSAANHLFVRDQGAA